MEKNKHFGLRYDVWKYEYCPNCNKFLSKTKVRSDLKETQLMVFMHDYIW